MRVLINFITVPMENNNNKTLYQNSRVFWNDKREKKAHTWLKFVIDDATYFEMNKENTQISETYALWLRLKRKNERKKNKNDNIVLIYKWMVVVGRVCSLPANSMQRNVLYQMSIRLELKALLLKWNRYFFCWFGDGYAICVLLRFVFLRGLDNMLAIGTVSGFWQWIQCALRVLVFAYDSTISCVPLFSCGVCLNWRIINIELALAASGEYRMEQCAGAIKQTNNGGILMTSVVDVVFFISLDYKFWMWLARM